MKRPIALIWAALALALFASGPLACQTAQPPANSSRSAKTSKTDSWRFAVSGDSRNCGDVVMPAIAAGVQKSGAEFYWHLGDFRKLTGVDEDIEHQPEHREIPLALPDYEQMAWKDFVDNQLTAFGRLPVYLAIGNHEMVSPRTRAEYVAQFRDWLDAPPLRAQRLRDDPSATEPRIYYHWIERRVDFITLDNATPDEFDADQLSWFERTLQADAADDHIRTLVVGMHEALPESISANHSMDQSQTGIDTGRRVYADLLKAQNHDGKRVYVLASHSHYFMDGTFNTEYWRTHGGVLPGWIIGTAGAQRYALPQNASDARAAETNVYGFLVATVSPRNEIQFDFHRLSEHDIPAAIARRYTPDFVHWCFAANSSAH